MFVLLCRCLFHPLFPTRLSHCTVDHVHTFEGVHYIPIKFIRDKERNWVSAGWLSKQTTHFCYAKKPTESGLSVYREFPAGDEPPPPMVGWLIGTPGPYPCHARTPGTGCTPQFPPIPPLQFLRFPTTSPIFTHLYPFSPISPRFPPFPPILLFVCELSENLNSNMPGNIMDLQWHG